MADEANGRTHEPGLRELTSNLDGLEKLLTAQINAIKEVVNERDRLYTERAVSNSKAVDAALAAQKDAVVKAQEAQTAYNQAHNQTIPRPEVEARFLSMEEKIHAIREMVTSGEGVNKGGKAVKEDARLVTLLIVSVVGTAFSMLISGAGLLLSLWKVLGPVTP